MPRKVAHGRLPSHRARGAALSHRGARGAFPAKRSLALAHGLRIDEVRWGTAVSDVEHGAKGALGQAAHAFVGEADAVRRHDDVVELQQRIRRWRRLFLEDVEAGTGKSAADERIVERALIDDRAARGVDQVGARLHQAQ